jgi:hypothetical protein
MPNSKDHRGGYCGAPVKDSGSLAALSGEGKGGRGEEIVAFL